MGGPAGCELPERAPEARPASALERAAEDWVGDYVNVRHLLRTRDWLAALAPDAGEALRVAALTHDIERRVPGGPRLDPRRAGGEDPAYLHEHARRSARIVDAWLGDGGVDRDTRAAVFELILRHETGGTPAADLLQAADSLSFLEVNAGRPRAWVDAGRCDLAQAQAKLDWMRDRVAVPAAAAAAAGLHARALVTLAA